MTRKDAQFYIDVLGAARRWLQDGKPRCAESVIQFGLLGDSPCERCPKDGRVKNLFGESEDGYSDKKV